MSDKNFIEYISKCSTYELLNIVLDNPEYLTDLYYKEFRDAIYKRAEDLD